MARNEHKDVHKKDPGPLVFWLQQPEDQDYPAAAQYLALLADDGGVAATVQALRDAPVTHQLAKDILRAAGLALLPRDNPHVASDLAKIAAGHKLSPVLLVRGNMAAGVPAHIADGYHRVCASYYTDENTDIPIKLAPLSAQGDGSTR
ncbi:hypothetical protein ACQCSX_17200 [Pseudarthrobacter sp. P1]|uniref:hypothetical protein n=1 Tax=Pseudarthrobacter sp. P1 TaxID=3418418 RepID=UPI003CF077E3